MELSRDVLVLDAAAAPAALTDWVKTQPAGAVLVSLELIESGQLVLQALPDVDPVLVAQIRKILGQHADVLRRLA